MLLFVSHRRVVGDGRTPTTRIIPFFNVFKNGQPSFLDDTEIQEARPGGHIDDVSHPKFIYSCDCKVSLYQVRGLSRLLCLTSGLDALSADKVDVLVA